MSSNESVLSGERTPSPRPTDTVTYEPPTPTKEGKIYIH